MTFDKIKLGQMFVARVGARVWVKVKSHPGGGYAISDNDHYVWFANDDEARPLPPVADIIRGFLDVMAGSNMLDLQRIGLKCERIMELSKLQETLTKANV